MYNTKKSLKNYKNKFINLKQKLLENNKRCSCKSRYNCKIKCSCRNRSAFFKNLH